MLLSLVISVRENAKDLLVSGSLLGSGCVGRFSELRDSGDIEVGHGLEKESDIEVGHDGLKGGDIEVGQCLNGPDTEVGQDLDNGSDIEVGQDLGGGDIEVWQCLELLERPPVRLDDRLGSAARNVCMAALVVTLSAGMWTHAAVMRERAWVVAWVVCVGGVS